MKIPTVHLGRKKGYYKVKLRNSDALLGTTKSDMKFDRRIQSHECVMGDLNTAYQMLEMSNAFHPQTEHTSKGKPILTEADYKKKYCR